MPRPRKYTDEQILNALREMKGMVYLAAERIGCEADTIYNRAKVSPAVAEAMRRERGKVVDTAELKLFTAILAGEPWAIQMALRTIGKDRGYMERSEVVNRKGEDFGAELRKRLDEVDGGGRGQPGETGSADAQGVADAPAPPTG